MHFRSDINSFLVISNLWDDFGSCYSWFWATNCSWFYWTSFVISKIIIISVNASILSENNLWMKRLLTVQEFYWRTRLKLVKFLKYHKDELPNVPIQRFFVVSLSRIFTKILFFTIMYPQYYGKESTFGIK